jgi:uncharacterized protein YggE
MWILKLKMMVEQAIFPGMRAFWLAARVRDRRRNFGLSQIGIWGSPSPNRRLLYLWALFINGDYMKWLVIIFCIMISAGLFAVVQGAEHTITMAGEGTVTTPADAVMISVSVESNNENMTEARAEVQRKIDNLLNVLKNAGVKDADILPGQSSGITSFQSSSKVCKPVNNTTVCENNSQKVSSLERSTVVRLNTTDESRINQVLDAARSAGADAYVAAYSLSDTSKAMAEARQKAMANAKENAAQVASEAGGSLGKVLDISDYGYPGVEAASSGSSGQMDMIDVTSGVVVTYEFIV